MSPQPAGWAGTVLRPPASPAVSGLLLPRSRGMWVFLFAMKWGGRFWMHVGLWHTPSSASEDGHNLTSCLPSIILPPTLVLSMVVRTTEGGEDHRGCPDEVLYRCLNLTPSWILYADIIFNFHIFQIMYTWPPIYGHLDLIYCTVHIHKSKSPWLQQTLYSHVCQD